MTSFQSFAHFLDGTNEKTILCDKAYAMAFDTGGDAVEQGKRFEFLRYEAMEGRGLSQDAFDVWLNETSMKCASGGYAFIEEALTEGVFGDLSDLSDKSPTEQLLTFPVHTLPKVLSSYIQAVAVSLQVPVDMPAVATLATLALCVQRTFAISPKPGWVEPLNLYCAIVAAPSERKSPVIKEISTPVHRFTSEENARRAPAIRDYERKRKILSTRVENMTKQAASGKGKVEVEEVLEAQRELDELEPVRPLRLLADDTTPEALTKLLAANGGKMCVMSTEGGLFTILYGL